MKTIILSAGTGSRLKHDKPKSLIDLDGRKLIEVQLNQLFLAGIKKEDINLVIGYKEELFEGYNNNAQADPNADILSRLAQRRVM